PLWRPLPLARTQANPRRANGDDCAPQGARTKIHLSFVIAVGKTSRGCADTSPAPCLCSPRSGAYARNADRAADRVGVASASMPGTAGARVRRLSEELEESGLRLDRT